MAGEQVWSVGAACVVLGYVVSVGVAELRASRRRPGDPLAPWLAALAAAFAVLLASNAVVVAGPSDDGVLVVRTLALTATLLVVVAAAHVAAGRRVPTAWLAVLGAVAAARIVLFVATDLVFAHRFDGDGDPVYGPWLLPTSLVALGVVAVAVVPVVRAWTAAGGVRVVAGVAASVAVVGASFVASGATAEYLTGAWALPLIAVLDHVHARRVTDDERARHALARSEADLARQVATARAAEADAEARERRRLADGLHDGPLQQLAVLRIRLDVAAGELRAGGGQHRPCLVAITDAASSVSQIGVGLRRLLSTMRPTPAELTIDDQVRFLTSLAERGAGDGVRADVDVDLAEQLGDDVFDTVCRVVTEALANVRRHARASRVLVSVRGAASHGTAEVVDDGVGFDVATLAVAADHLGLDELERRVRRAGGVLDIASTPGVGTAIRLHWATADLARDGVASAVTPM